MPIALWKSLKRMAGISCLKDFLYFLHTDKLQSFPMKYQKRETQITVTCFFFLRIKNTASAATAATAAIIPMTIPAVFAALEVFVSDPVSEITMFLFSDPF